MLVPRSAVVARRYRTTSARSSIRVRGLEDPVPGRRLHRDPCTLVSTHRERPVRLHWTSAPTGTLHTCYRQSKISHF